MTAVIPFNHATITDGDLSLAVGAIERGHTAGNGPSTAEVERHLAEIHDGARTLLSTSCTHALELAALLLDADRGSEVIVPAYTFVSTASAFLLHGMTPVFVDVDADTLNIDVDAVEAAIGPRTRAVCAVHYAGVGAQPDRLAALAKRHELAIVEDNAHGLGGRWDGRTLGTFGALSTLSFHETKNITCGEGGALVVNNPTFVERAEILREKGTDRARFLRGQVDKYTWVDVGSSWVPSDILAAILVGQLGRLEEIQSRRLMVWNRYAAELAQWAAEHGIRLPVIPSQADHTAHMFHLRFATRDERTDFIEHMHEGGVSTVFHYQSLHLSEVGRRLGGKPGQHPVTEDASDTLVRLPLFGSITPEQVDRVIERTISFVPTS